VRAGFADPVMQTEVLTLTYPDARSVARDLHAIGATNAAQGRRRTLTGRRRFERALAALEAAPGRTPDGRIPATFEVIYGHAWKAAPRFTAEGHAVVTFDRRGRA
jgi:malonyl-CoA O-methyltransferase